MNRFSRRSPYPSRCRPRSGRRWTAFFLALLAPAALATSYLELGLDEMLGRAEIALYAEVTAVETELRDGEPWTVVTFAPERDLLQPPEASVDIDAAEEPLDEVQLAFLGGTVAGGPTLIVTLMPSFEVGERVLVLAYAADYASPIVGFRQGLWRDGELGLVDLAGRSLSLDDDGALQLDGSGAGTEALLQALERRLRELP